MSPRARISSRISISPRARVPRLCAARRTAAVRVVLPETDSTQDVVLQLSARLRSGIEALRLTGRALVTDTNVPVVAHALLGESAEDLVPVGAEVVHPLLHEVQHLALDLGATDVEIGVETV